MLFYIIFYPLSPTFNYRDTPTHTARIEPTIGHIVLTGRSVEFRPLR